MNLTKHHAHGLIVLAAILLGVVALMLPKRAHAQNNGYYTTTSSSTSSSSTDANGVTTTTTNSSTSTPRDIYSTRADRNRDYWRNGTSDSQARYPYDNTNGRNRSDVDAVRSGFDDPRNPWDGRYVNDNPRNSARGAGSNATVNSMRGSGTYSPGRFGTKRVGNR